MSSNNQMGVSEFYQGKDVFITGVTGFVGKVLLEKILRCCEVGRIFVLVRPKRGNTVEERREQMFQSELFRRIKEEKADVLNKVHFLCGDICKKNLGLDRSDISEITENVSIVIHCAASVSFSLSLKESIAANVTSTKEMADLCRNMRNLLAFVYVSTAFSNCNLREIDERIYPLQASTEGVLKAAQLFDDNVFEAMGQELLNGRPNTYTLTKAMAENLLNECYRDLPWVIVRPAIVVASWKEPIPGWIQGLSGATGILTGNLKAVLSSMVLDQDKRAEVIPVDCLVNALLVAAWDKGIRRSLEPKIYHLTSTGFNALYWSDVWYNYKQMFWKCPPTDVFLTFRMKITTNVLLHQIRVIFEDYILAILVDLFFALQGKKMRMLKSCQGMNKLLGTLRPFMTTEWDFHTKNTHELLQKLSSKDREVFDFDIARLSWKTFMENYALGIRKFILKEDPDTIPQARKSIMRRHFVLTTLLLLLRTLALYKCIGVVWKYCWIILK